MPETGANPVRGAFTPTELLVIGELRYLPRGWIGAADAFEATAEVRVRVVDARAGAAGGGPGTATIAVEPGRALGWRPSPASAVAAVGASTPAFAVPANERLCYTARVRFEDGTRGGSDASCLVHGAGERTEVVLRIEVGP